jgi:hypothetical protein
VTPLGIDPGTVRLVAQRLNHYATPGPDPIMKKLNTHSKSENMVSLLKISFALNDL